MPLPKLAAAALCLVATAAVADPTPASLPTDLKHPAGAVYASIPPGEFLRIYPNRALRLGVAGEVRLRCLVGAAGELKRCTILAEDPRGYGFAGAAAQLSAYFHARPTATDGEPTAGKTVVIPIHFVAAANPATPPAAATSPPPR